MRWSATSSRCSPPVSVERAKRLQAPVDLPEPRDRDGLARTLTALGTQLLREMSDPAVIAVFRLAIAEAVRTPAVARTLDATGGEASRAIIFRRARLRDAGPGGPGY